HVAAYYGRADIAHVLIQHGAAVDIQEKRGWTPPHDAAQQGHGDPECRKGRTPLFNTASNGHVEVARVLLENGADITVMDTDGLRALDHAEAKGHTEVVRLLLDRDAGIHAENPPHGEPAAPGVHEHRE
ncbi:uncharacterized protein PHACADRAFT_97049, partial [Phanerochaete carnosa HHB-10118-sp]